MASFSGGSMRKRIYDRYKIIGFISSGTYGRVYKAQGKSGQTGEFAIKKYRSSYRFKRTRLSFTGSSPTRKGKLGIRAFLSPPSGKWPSALSYHTPTSCTRLKSYLKTSAYT